MIRKLTEVAEVESARRMSLASAKFGPAVCSIYAYFDDYNVEHLGSGTLIKWRTNTFLVTADHLFQEGRKAPEFFAATSRGSGPVSLQKRFVRAKGESDIAMCALGDADVRLLAAETIDAKEFFTWPRSQSGHAMCSLGWPNTKNRVDRYRRTEPTQLLVGGPSKSATELSIDAEHDRYFVYQKFDPSGALDNEGIKTNPPRLKGLSGGLTIWLGDPLDPEVLSGRTECRPHPLGICTMQDAPRRLIRSSRLGGFLKDFFESGNILEA